MKRFWFAAAIAALFLASPAAAQSVEPTPQALALGQRYMAATGGMYATMQQQVYATAAIMGDTPTAHARQRALLQAEEQNRAEIDALDAKLASLMAQTFSEAELKVAVNFLESPLGRSITQKKHDFFAALFTPGRPALAFTPEESAALAAYDNTPEAASMRAKLPALMAQAATLSAPVQKDIWQSATTIFCHATRRCTGGDSTYDQLSGPTFREP